MRINRIAAVLLAVLFLSAACSSQPAETLGDEAGLIEVVDCVGRTVQIPEDPQRIACLYASTAHILAMYDEQQCIVAAPDGVRRDVLMQHKYPGVTDIAVPIQEGSINVEELLRVNADIALVRKSTYENPAEVEKLEKVNIPFLVVDYSTMDELKLAISVVGDIFQKQQQGEEFLKFFDDTVELVRQRTADIPQGEKKRVFHSVNQATRTDIKGDICDEITTLAGIINVATEGEGLKSQGGEAYTTLEQIYNWSPEYIMGNDPAAVQYILTDSKWQGLQAVIDKRVFTLPTGVTRWCHPGSMEPHMAALFIARQFYPERFEDIDLMDYTADYYKRFFNLELDRETVIKILSGQGMRIPKSDNENKE